VEYLRDLYAHQEWADAAHWRAILSHPAARDDRVLRERLHHIHLVQHAFLSVVGGEEVRLTEPHEFATLASLQHYARDAHARATSLLDRLQAERLREMVRLPWFQEPPLDITAGQALLQAAMHSHYHRGQNATRLRELGGAPPQTDLVVWYWQQRPAAQWP
jgi:uncharacterized damage-inducible protein DinB